MKQAEKISGRVEPELPGTRQVERKRPGFSFRSIANLSQDKEENISIIVRKFIDVVSKAKKKFRTVVQKYDEEFVLIDAGTPMVRINTLQPGDSLGELALISPILHEKRSATVLCSKNCDFAVLDKKHFTVEPV